MIAAWVSRDIILALGMVVSDISVEIAMNIAASSANIIVSLALVVVSVVVVVRTRYEAP